MAQSQKAVSKAAILKEVVMQNRYLLSMGSMIWLKLWMLHIIALKL